MHADDVIVHNFSGFCDVRVLEAAATQGKYLRHLTLVDSCSP